MFKLTRPELPAVAKRESRHDEMKITRTWPRERYDNVVCPITIQVVENEICSLSHVCLSHQGQGNIPDDRTVAS